MFNVSTTLARRHKQTIKQYANHFNTEKKSRNEQATVIQNSGDSTTLQESTNLADSHFTIPVETNQYKPRYELRQTEMATDEIIKPKRQQTSFTASLPQSLYDFSDARRFVSGFRLSRSTGRDATVIHQPRPTSLTPNTHKRTKPRPIRKIQTSSSQLPKIRKSNQLHIHNNQIPYSSLQMSPNRKRMVNESEKKHSTQKNNKFKFGLDFRRSAGREIIHAWMLRCNPKGSHLSYNIRYPQDVGVKGTPSIGKCTGRDKQKHLFAYGEKQLTDLFYTPKYDIVDRHASPSAHIHFGETGRAFDSGAKGKCITSDIIIARVNRELKAVKRIDHDLYTKKHLPYVDV